MAWVSGRHWRWFGAFDQRPGLGVPPPFRCYTATATLSVSYFSSPTTCISHLYKIRFPTTGTVTKKRGQDPNNFSDAETMGFVHSPLNRQTSNLPPIKTKLKALPLSCFKFSFHPHLVIRIAVVRLTFVICPVRQAASTPPQPITKSQTAPFSSRWNHCFSPPA